MAQPQICALDQGWDSERPSALWWNDVAEGPSAGTQLKTRMQKGTVLEAFLHSNSRFYHIIRTFPLHVVTNSSLGLLGARQYASFLLTNPAFGK